MATPEDPRAAGVVAPEDPVIAGLEPHAGPLHRAWRRLRRTGPRRSLSYVRHLASERYHETRLGIRTIGAATTVAAGQRPGLCKTYAPVPYAGFHAAGRVIELETTVRPGLDVFLDYGAGRGRAMVLAASWPFRRVLGVEIDPGLARTARENFARVTARLRCRDLEILTADAAEFGCPDEATVLHFFDPFAGILLERVLQSIEASLQRAPRPLTILYADPHHFAPLAASCTWLVKRCQVPYPHPRGTDPIRESYYVYEGRV